MSPRPPLRTADPVYVLQASCASRPSVGLIAHSEAGVLEHVFGAVSGRERVWQHPKNWLPGQGVHDVKDVERLLATVSLLEGQPDLRWS